MEAKELRIGNFVIDTCIDKMIEISFEHFEYSEDFNPIPLTEEWLFKLGFSSCFSSDPQYKDASKKYELSDFVIHQPNENEKLFIYETGLEVNSIHQLQNLHFALTNEELTIE